MVYSEITDLDLVNLIHLGNRNAYTELYKRYAMQLLNHAYMRVHCREEAKDIVQELFTKLWHKRKEIIVSKNVSAFLYRSVQNIILNQIAHNDVTDKYIKSITHFAKNDVPIADHLIREKQFAKLIEEEIANLTPKMREVFELSRSEYLSHKMIATKLGISEQTVSKHISNALRILRNKLASIICFLFLLQ